MMFVECSVMRILGLAAVLGAVGLAACASDGGSGMSVDQVFERVRAHNFEDNDGSDSVGDLTDDAWRVRTLAIRDLVRLGSTSTAGVVAGMRDKNRHVRHVCVAALGILGVKEACDDLLTALANDPDPIVRGQAAQALGQIGCTQAVPALKTAARGDSSKYVQHRAELAAGRFKEGATTGPELIDVWTGLDETTFRKLELGKSAPGFELKDTHGKTWRLSDFKNKRTVALIWVFADW